MSLVKPITPCLWFDTDAREATEFYCSVFPDSHIDVATHIRTGPSSDCNLFYFRLCGQPFMALRAGSTLRFNPSLSFLVNFDPSRDAHAREHLDMLWAALSDGGRALMPLDAYSFSPHFGWVQDRFGLSWQLILSNPDGEPRPTIVPALMFTGDVCGKAEEAGAFYRSVFDDSRAGLRVPYPAGAEPDREGTTMFSDFRIGDTWIAAMDSAHPHGYGFHETVSFVLSCRDQAEIDRYWAQLSSVPEAEICGWCKDRFGLSWQVSPMLVDEVMASGDSERIERFIQAVMSMRKLDLAKLEAASAGTK